jgi:hypothetical protein
MVENNDDWPGPELNPRRPGQSLDPDPRRNDGQFSMASCAVPVPLDPQFSLATCAYFGPVVDAENMPAPKFKSEKWDRRILREGEKLRRKQLKAEAKAQELLKQIIGLEQWRTYRRSNRVVLKPKNHFWIIGNYFEEYKKAKPFNGKPDVIRIDNDKKLHVTLFCVAQAGGENTPFTDKVIFFASHLIDNEKMFVEMANRIGERTFKTIKESAIWAI